ncbi:SDR family NAD(P)-dependent oxidoreductase [soil metagenome]
MTLGGKTAIVTGASSGIGKATARRLVESGCNVVLAARREERLNDLASELGDQALPVPTDITSPADCAALAARTVERFGDLDILVNNAGLGLFASIPEGNPDDWRTMFEVNVLGVLYITRATVRYMLEDGSGDIVFISSIAGRRIPTPESTVYAATKHAVNAIAKGLRMDLTDQGIRSINVEPGLVRTEFPERSHSSAEDFYENKGYAPLEAEDIANAVLYALQQPARVSVNEVLVRSTEQTS